ncbi:MAG TPA: F0F1 ATP synthase subunit B [Gammaproteobacteria bacterium]|nr:F0F1 ATP synthase subunit B [Gammaproteobacteria bacterium]
MSVSILTLLGQIITFALLVWFVKRFLWGPMLQMMENRQQRIADGLAAAERGRHEQQLAEDRATELLHEAKGQAAEIISRAEKRATEIVEEAKADARSEGDRLLAAARAEIDQELNRVKEELRSQVAGLAVSGAEKILEREIDEKAHSELLNKLVAQI